MTTNTFIHTIGGGTVSHIRPHLALCAPAYGKTAHIINRNLLDASFKESKRNLFPVLHMTRMAGGNSTLSSNEDISNLLDKLISIENTKMIFMPVALCDFEARVGQFKDQKWVDNKLHGLNAPRLMSRDANHYLKLYKANKLIGKIRKTRKDIFLVGFKTTTGASLHEQFWAGLNLCKEASCNLVLSNDLHTRQNMIITPEEAPYCITTDREFVLKELVTIALARSDLRFTRSTVVDGRPVAWHSELVPSNLRTVVDYCIEKKAYKPFRGSTAGHFAVKIDNDTFLTSRRKTNFNQMNEVGLVKITTNGRDKVIAHGSKPSVGGQSQRIIFRDHPDCDCIVHFHCPQRQNARDKIPLKSQKEVECGSHECGENTSSGLKKFGNLYAVMLDNHGPNIVFNRKTSPQEVIDFIDANFDLAQKSGLDRLEQRMSNAG